MYFVDFDVDTKKIIGFYNDKINHSIPESAIPITDEQWQEFSISPEKYILENGEIILSLDNPQPEPIPTMNLNGFNIQMMLSDGYTRIITNTTNQEAKTRLEIAAVRLELLNLITEQDWQIFKLIWDAVIDAIPTGILVSTDLEQIKQIASTNNMPFNFDSEFKLHFLE
ncbi:hypothetical protein NIES2109_33940 [Nostoc sp. HK-01]|nr:hypothetical protein NIES2109_33940 [Nostoc sp. HK-01]